MTKAVLVVGAGPSGMAQVNALVGAAELEVRCFEMNSEIGGLWTWTDDVGDCHGSMYRYHQTNGLNEFLELEEYSFLEHFGHLITSYPPRAVMLDYLKGWTKKMGGDECITLNRKVTSVTYDAAGTKKFTVVSHDTTTDARHIDYFDSVVCCNGLCGNQPVRRVLFLGDDAAVLAPSSGEQQASPRHRAGFASMAWKSTRRFNTNAP